MVILIGVISCRPDKREDFLKIAQEMIASPKEGCISYRVTEDINTPNDFIFVEEWESREAIDRSFQSRHSDQCVRQLLDLMAGLPSVKIHEVSTTDGL